MFHVQGKQCVLYSDEESIALMYYPAGCFGNDKAGMNIKHLMPKVLLSLKLTFRQYPVVHINYSRSNRTISN